MPICVVVLAESVTANQFSEKLREAGSPLIKTQLIQPPSKGLGPNSIPPQGISEAPIKMTQALKPIDFESVNLLNPKISRQRRQKTMALGLMPFGFVAGLTFTQMTGLQTFSALGLGTWGELIIGSMLGMGAGWIGSHVATSSVNPPGQSDDIRNLRKLSEEGKWLLLLETPVGIELPWQKITEMHPLEIMRVSEL